MKMKCIILMIWAMVSVCQAQSVKPYLAVIKTEKGNVKGVLHRSAPEYLVVNGKDGLVKVDLEQVKSIKIRLLKKGYQPTRMFIYDPYDESNFEQVKNGPKVRKNGEEDPSLEEHVAIAILMEFFNVIANLAAAPIHAINPSLAKYQVDGKALDPVKARELSYYSIIYQLNPEPGLFGK